MITLAADCLLFRMTNGETVPFSAEMISIELLGETARLFEPEFVRHAANAVFHYFKHELGRQSLTLGEFAGALEKVLRGFHLPPSQPSPPVWPGSVCESDLCELVRESGQGWELFFFPRLRDELRRQLHYQPRVLRFRGLRGCVKQLAGARRWSSRCRQLEEQIVEYLRECLGADAGAKEYSLLVE